MRPGVIAGDLGKLFQIDRATERALRRFDLAYSLSCLPKRPPLLYKRPCSRSSDAP
jgi:hypothetical protein